MITRKSILEKIRRLPTGIAEFGSRGILPVCGLGIWPMAKCFVYCQRMLFYWLNTCSSRGLFWDNYVTEHPPPPLQDPTRNGRKAAMAQQVRAIQ